MNSATALLAFGVAATIFYLWKTGKLDEFVERAQGRQKEGLEFLKLPDEEDLSPNVAGVELIHFRGNGLELLVPPWLQEVEGKKNKEMRLRPIATMLTGKNLTGYFQMLAKLLFILEKRHIFLTVKERDIERFKRHSNVIISIFKLGSEMIEEMKMLEFQFHKGVINEDDFKKKILKLRMQGAKSRMKNQAYDGYKYFSNPVEILRDAKSFLEKTKGNGILVVTIIDEMMEKNPRKATLFLEDLTKLATQYNAPLILTCEQGIYDEKVPNKIKSYCDMVMETSLSEGKRYVTVYSFEKVFPKKRVSEALSKYQTFLKKIEFSD